MSQECAKSVPPPPPNLRAPPNAPVPFDISTIANIPIRTSFIPPPPPPPRISSNNSKVQIEAAKTAILPPPIARIEINQEKSNTPPEPQVHGIPPKITNRGNSYSETKTTPPPPIAPHPSTINPPPPPPRQTSFDSKMRQPLPIINSNNNFNSQNYNNIEDSTDETPKITISESPRDKVKFDVSVKEDFDYDKVQTRVNLKLKKPPQRPLSQSYETASKVIPMLDKKPLSSTITSEFISSKIALRQDASALNSPKSSLPLPPPRGGKRPVSSKLLPLIIHDEDEDKSHPPPPPSRTNRRPLSSKIENFIVPAEDYNHTADEVEESYEESGPSRTSLKRSGTMSTITSDWAELETEIMSAAGDTEAQSIRLSRTNISSALESERMKFLLVNHDNDGRNSSQFLSKMGNEKIQTDRIKTLEQMLKDHQRALNAKGQAQPPPSARNPPNFPANYPSFQSIPMQPLNQSNDYPPPPPPPPPPMVKKNTEQIIHETTLKTNKKDKESDLLLKLKRKMSSKKKNEELQLSTGQTSAQNTGAQSGSNQVGHSYSNESEIPDSVLFMESKKYLDSFLPPSNNVHFIEILKENCKVRALFGERCDRLCFDDFESEDNEESIIFENDELAYSTFCKLIQQLTHHKIATSAVLISTFLLTFRAFYEPVQLLELLIFRFYGTSPDPDPSWAKEKNIPIKTRVLVVLMKWIDKFYDKDFAPNGQVMQLLALWLDDQDNMPKEISNMLDVVKRTIGRNSANLKLTDIHPTEIARQLALIEKNIFDRIGPAECLRQGWAKEGKESNSPNIYQMIMRFNTISNWVSSEIVKVEDVKERAVVLNRFVIIAEESRALSNYNAVMEIIAGLQSAPIYRLKNTWSLLPTKTWDIWDNLNEIMSNEDNFSLYRNTLKNSKPPCIPYIGIYLTDLVFVEDGNLDYKPNTDLINITKLRFTASITFGLDQFQQKKYNLVEVPVIQQYLSYPPFFPEDKLREFSLKVEPRQ